MSKMKVSVSSNQQVFRKTLSKPPSHPFHFDRSFLKGWMDGLAEIVNGPRHMTDATCYEEIAENQSKKVLKA